MAAKGESTSDAYETRTLEVVSHLRDAIYAGRLEAGQPIRQEAVAEELGVSRLPVREALRQLEAEGLVVSRPHIGARVALLDFAECEVIYKIRERLDPLAFAESVANITDEQVEAARALYEELEHVRDDLVAYLEYDRDLHLACNAGVASPRLLQMVSGLWGATQQYRRILLRTYGAEDWERQRAEHYLIVEALAARNARAGEELVRSHIENSRLRLARNRDLFDR